MPLLELVQKKEWTPDNDVGHPPREAVDKLHRDLIAVRDMEWEAKGPDKAMQAGLFDALAATGLFALTVPEQYGGLGASNEEFTRIIRTASTIGACVAITAVPHLCNGVKSIGLFGTEKIKKEVFAQVLDGKLISFALTEDHTGSNVPSIRSKVEPDGNEYRLNGSKLWVTNVPFACCIVVVAKSPDLSPIPNGSTFVLVDPGAQGLTISKTWHKLAADGSPTVNLFLDNIRVAESQLFGDRGKAINHFNTIVETGRLGAAAGAAGTAQQSLALARRDARKNGLGEHLLPQGDFDCFAMHAVLRYSGFLCDINHGERGIITALCKLFCTHRAMSMVQDIFSWYLSNGVPLNPDVERMLKEIPFFKIVEGPSEVITFHAMLSMVSKLATKAPGIDTPKKISHGSSLENQLGQLGRQLAGFALQVSEMRPMIQHQNALWSLAQFAAAIHTAQCVFAVTAWEKDMGEDRAVQYRKRAVNEAIQAFHVIRETLNT